MSKWPHMTKNDEKWRAFNEGWRDAHNSGESVTSGEAWEGSNERRWGLEAIENDIEGPAMSARETEFKDGFGRRRRGGRNILKSWEATHTAFAGG